nr:MurR/RpiR family transcriptional regulator [Saccharopolyspora sp. HNM0983]
MNTLTRSQRLLAERIMSDPEGVAFMTVSELADAVDVNESTVVRFASSLGLDGYPGLTRLCRQRLQEQAQLLRRLSNLESVVDHDRDPLELATSYDQANLARSASRVDRPSWDGAVQALGNARGVHVMGLRKCFAPAFLLGYLLRLVRDEVAVLGQTPGMLTDELRRVAPGDCFAALSIHRYSTDTVRAFSIAKRRGATTVALTDNPASPLAGDADHVFYLDTTGVSVLRSLTAFTSVVQALATEVAAARGAQARSALLVEEELLDEFGVYTGSDIRRQSP